MGKKVAINGFGRIGRLVFRQIMEEDGPLDLVALNDIAPLNNLAYLLKHDSVQAAPTVEVEARDGALRYGDREVRFLSQSSPGDLPWQDMGVELVIEASGVYTSYEKSQPHLDAGAGHVLITAPADGVKLTVCMGVNEEKWDAAEHRIVSNASCTTNCLAVVARVLDENFGIEDGFLTTCHAVTASQSIVDAPAKKWRRGRSGMLNIVPTTTGAARATTEVLPRLEGKLDGLALRVPVGTGSIIDFVVHTEQPVTVEKVNGALHEASRSDRLQGILGYSDEELVSQDIVGTDYSAIVDGKSTMTLRENTAKVLAWYDNEWGYARRVVDLAQYMAERT